MRSTLPALLALTLPLLSSCASGGPKVVPSPARPAAGAVPPSARRDDRRGLSQPRQRRHLRPQREPALPRRQHDEGAGDDGALPGDRRKGAAARPAAAGAQPIPEPRGRLLLLARSQGGRRSGALRGHRLHPPAGGADPADDRPQLESRDESPDREDRRLPRPGPDAGPRRLPHPHPARRRGRQGLPGGHRTTSPRRRTSRSPWPRSPTGRPSSRPRAPR